MLLTITTDKSTVLSRYNKNLFCKTELQHLMYNSVVHLKSMHSTLLVKINVYKIIYRYLYFYNMCFNYFYANKNKSTYSIAFDFLWTVYCFFFLYIYIFLQLGFNSTILLLVISLKSNVNRITICLQRSWLVYFFYICIHTTYIFWKLVIFFYIIYSEKITMNLSILGSQTIFNSLFKNKGHENWFQKVSNP